MSNREINASSIKDEASPPASPREYLSDSEMTYTSNEEEIDADLGSVDFSSDFTTGPGRTEIIKAIATRWSTYVIASKPEKQCSKSDAFNWPFPVFFMLKWQAYCIESRTEDR